jgi:hypothetical protein
VGLLSGCVCLGGAGCVGLSGFGPRPFGREGEMVGGERGKGKGFVIDILSLLRVFCVFVLGGGVELIDWELMGE